LKHRTITVRLDNDLKPIVDEMCRRSGQTRSEVMCEAPRRRPARFPIRVIAPPRHAVRETGGHLTDEDVLNALS
jgi:predicted transcriptional regulator